MQGRVEVRFGGDANLDGRVNLLDFNILAANFGASPRTFEQGDFDLDGIVNLNDFNILAAHFGAGAAPPLSGNVAVPEPAGAVIALAPLAALLRRRRQT
jgi:hypothetical protein